jgi:radical SAM protein with 4Fe4S-binding SPASM domain
MAWLRLNISNLCNFSCKHCHVFKISENRLPKSLMSYEIMDRSIKTVIGLIKKHGEENLTISIYGGETLLNKKNLFKIVKKYGTNCSGVSIYWIVNTNGSLLIEDDAKFAKENNLDIHVSCDGAEQTHNKTKLDKFGKGTFSQVKKALELIKKFQVLAQLNSYVMPENIDHLKEIVDVAKEFGISRIYLDLFYSPDMINAEEVFEKYMEVYSYGLENGVRVTGPWTRLLEARQRGESLGVEVAVDGSFFFNAFPLSRKMKFNVKDLEKIIDSKKYSDFKSSTRNYYNERCSGCSIYDICGGTAIAQFQYHVIKEEGYEEVCNFMKMIIPKLKEDEGFDHTEKMTTRTTGVKLFQVAITYNCNKNCSYCFAKSLRGSYDDMTLDDFKQLLDWMEKNGIKRFNFTGGEPTIHPKIKEFIEMAYRRGFNFSIFSNGLFSENEIDNFNHVDSFLINYNLESHYTKGEYKLLHHNLENLVKRKIKINIMFCITDEIRSCEHILKACKKYSVTDVLLDFTIPDSLKSNKFIDYEEFETKKKLIVGFIKKLRKQKIKVSFARPMPRCIFTKDELKEFKQDMYFRCGSGEGNTIITVNPDLTTFPCLSIFFRGPRVTSLRNISEFTQFYKKSLDNLRWQRVLYDKCKSCVYFIRKECQNACLCYKCKQFNIHQGDSYVIYSQYRIKDIEKFIKLVDRSISRLNKIFGKLNKKINIFLFDNRDDLLYYSGVYFYPKWVSGFAYSNLSYFAYSNKVSRRILHELCHLYIQNFAKSKVPTWLNEGFCEFVTLNNNFKRLKKLMRTKKLLPFEKLLDCGHMSLLEYDKSPPDNNICYNQSNNFVCFLVNNFGIDKVMHLITGEYNDFYKHVQATMGKSFSNIERDWLKSLT